MSKRTAILKKLMVATTVMTMTFGGSMTAFAAEGDVEGGQGTEDPTIVVVVDDNENNPTDSNKVDEEAATEAEKEILGNPDESQTESEKAIYQEYTDSDYIEFSKEVAEEIDRFENYTDPDSQNIATEAAKNLEEGDKPIETVAEGDAHITIVDESLENEDVLQGRTEVNTYSKNSGVPLAADEESAKANVYIVTLNSTNISALGSDTIEAAVTVPVAVNCDDPSSAVAYVNPNTGLFVPVEKVDLSYDSTNGTWTVKITLNHSQQSKIVNGEEYPVSYNNYGTIYMIKYDAVKKQVVVEPVQPGEEPSVNENESVVAMVDASSLETSTVAPVNDYYQFNLNAAKAIREAAYGSTVEINAGEYVSFADFVIEEIDKRPDLTINVNYIDAANGHSQEKIVIPARAVESDGTVLGESRIEEPETKYYGFRYVDTKINA